MRVLRIALLLFLSLCAVIGAYGAGQGFNEALPDHYHDSDPSVYRFFGFLWGGCGALFAVGALYLLARIVGGDVQLRLPLSAYALVAALIASTMPYEGWIDASGFFDSVGYAINALLIGLTIVLVQVTMRDLERQREQNEGNTSLTGTVDS
jgi:hypothetical protein